MTKTIRHTYSDEEIEYLKKVTPGKSTYEITELFNTHFNLNLKRSQIKSVIKNRGYKTGLDMTFKKGNVPYNKGTIGLAKPNKTSFKRGHKTHNKLPVGTEVMKGDGYLWIKIGNPNYWLQTHRLEYMRHHGEIPEGVKIVFLNQDRTNVDIKNLIAVTSQELQILNKRRLLTEDINLSNVGVNTAKLIAATHRKINRGKS